MPVLKTPGFSLDRTLATKQTYGWKRVMSIDGVRHIIVSGDRIVVAHQWKRQGQTFTMFWGPDTDFFDFWFTYFDLQHDYMHTSRQCRSALGPLSRAERCVSGFHLLNLPQYQEYIEAHIRSHVRSHKNALSYYNGLCAACCGVKHKTFNGLGSVQWVPFPTAEQVIEKQDELYWYLPRKVSMSIILATMKYVNGEEYELPPLMSDKNASRLEHAYHMDPASIADWFMDGTDHDVKYMDTLLKMADKYDWAEPEI